MDYKKTLKGISKSGKEEKKWWMGIDCTRPTAGLEKTREFQLVLWARGGGGGYLG